jgi:hypothetical protein
MWSRATPVDETLPVVARVAAAAAPEIEQQVTLPRTPSSMRDPKMSRSDTVALVTEMTDATAIKSAKTVVQPSGS